VIGQLRTVLNPHIVKGMTLGGIAHGSRSTAGRFV